MSPSTMPETQMDNPFISANFEDQDFALSSSPGTAAKLATRRIVQTTSGRRHGPINRLVSPSDIGELIKPFVFLDHAEVVARPEPLYGIHPHSGIATLTVVLRGGMVYEDTTGKTGSVPTGGLEWMRAGNGVWHDGGALPGEPLRAFQLWVALPPSDENGPAESQYISPDEVQTEGPARVILGRYGRAVSPIRAPKGINYLHVNLKDGERWRYTPPDGHTIAWLAVDTGALLSQVPIRAGELAVFEESNRAIELEAHGATSFVLGSAIKHPHPLVLGRYSVHTSRATLAQGEAEIVRISHRLRAEGRL
jgi:redox-sensitive bicupin YhaK (pirin superfamily)